MFYYFPNQLLLVLYMPLVFVFRFVRALNIRKYFLQKYHLKRKSNLSVIFQCHLKILNSTKLMVQNVLLLVRILASHYDIYRVFHFVVSKVNVNGTEKNMFYIFM